MVSIHRTLLLVLIGACASTVLASAQATSSQTEVNTEANEVAGGSSPVAYVYISSSPSNGKNQINAYSAAANGALSPIPGTPFSTPAYAMALNGTWLFATDGSNIDSFSIAANGALNEKDSYNAENGGLLSLFLDHTGSTLYTDFYTTNNDYLSYSIDQSTGQLMPVNDLSGGPSNNGVLSFIGNNEFAYSSSCYHFTPDIYGVQRASDGALTYLSSNPPFPAPPSGDFWCPWLAAADPTNHVAVAMQPLNGDFTVEGPYQLASYTADSSGNLTTTNTYQNMPKVLVGSAIYDYQMSPDGKFLAVGGISGLQIFHFNGANPITKMTGLLAANGINQLFWDNKNHLYAISWAGGKLYVLTVTSTGVSQAPGSPHPVTKPEGISVLPKS
jgi:hypothetical protein